MFSRKWLFIGPSLLFALTCGADVETYQCEKLCSGTLGQKYQKNYKYDYDHLKEINQCLTENYAASVAGPSLEEMRTFFEVTGELYKQDLVSDKSPNYETVEIGTLERAAGAGLGKFVWLVGATDCLEHAEKLRQHLSETLGSKEFEFEVVNSVTAIDRNSFINFNAIKPMANHYIVRAVSKVTGKSYLVDGYTGVSVGRETDLRKKMITFNTYESCFLAKVTEVKRETLKRYAKMTNPLGEAIREWILGEEANNSLMDLGTSLTPMLKSLIGEEAKAAAASCMAGAKTVSIKKGLVLDD